VSSSLPSLWCPHLSPSSGVVKLFLEVNGDSTKKYCSGQVQYIECFAEEKHRLFIMEILLHCADISNPYKPFHICAKWADLVSQEFFTQGDKERELGIDISPMMDRNNANLNNMQIGFIEFVVSPLISSEYPVLLSSLVLLSLRLASLILLSFLCYSLLLFTL
jgi:hypothetical protein